MHKLTNTTETTCSNYRIKNYNKCLRNYDEPELILWGRTTERTLCSLWTYPMRSITHTWRAIRPQHVGTSMQNFCGRLRETPKCKGASLHTYINYTECEQSNTHTCKHGVGIWFDLLLRHAFLVGVSVFCKSQSSTHHKIRFLVPYVFSRFLGLLTIAINST